MCIRDSLMIAYDRAPFSASPVKWNLPKLWTTSIILGILLAIGTWVCYGTLMHIPNVDGFISERAGLVHKSGFVAQILFLEIALTQNWLIFITRSQGTIWSSCPSWQLAGAVLVVDVVASLFCRFGLFTNGLRTDWITIIQVWIFSLLVFALMAIVYHLLQTGDWVDNLLNWRSRRAARQTKMIEDFAIALQRVSVRHEQESQAE